MMREEASLILLVADEGLQSLLKRNPVVGSGWLRGRLSVQGTQPAGCIIEFLSPVLISNQGDIESVRRDRFVATFAVL
jgi:hypothetical protein